MWCVLGSPPIEPLLLWKGHYREGVCLLARQKVGNMCWKDLQSRCTEDKTAQVDLLL